VALALLACAAVLAGCGDSAGTADAPGSTTSATASGVPIGEFGNVSPEDLRQALLGDPPYPPGWEDQVDELVADVSRLLDGLRVPSTSEMSAAEASCAVWQPLVGHTLWATGAFVERQFFIAHVATLAGVAPREIRDAAGDALAISAAAAATQMTPDGDPEVISRRPVDAIREIGLWAVEHCALPIEAEPAPDTSGWTADDIAWSCDLDRRLLEEGQEDYLAGPGHGRYAEHPHTLEVTLEAFVYPAWHRLASVDNDADPPTFTVEPIPDAFCDR
jgi:hypothetical protein